jgi:hypothetical protein
MHPRRPHFFKNCRRIKPLLGERDAMKRKMLSVA